MAEYIERENAYKLISEQKEKETGMYSIGRNTGLNIAKSIIHSKEQCPSADVVEVRHGEWIDCKCSVCNKTSPTLYLDEYEMEYRIKKTPYCPYCGAKMDGKGDNDG